MVEDRKIGYGRIVAEGQQAAELAADQRLVALKHPVQSDRPSDQTNEPTRWTDSQNHCPLQKGGLGGLSNELNLSGSE